MHSLSAFWLVHVYKHIRTVEETRRVFTTDVIVGVSLQPLFNKKRGPTLRATISACLFTYFEPSQLTDCIKIAAFPFTVFVWRYRRVHKLRDHQQDDVQDRPGTLDFLCRCCRERPAAGGDTAHPPRGDMFSLDICVYQRMFL